MEKKKPKFDLYRSWFQYRWRLRAPNGEIIAQGEGFFRKEKCLRSIHLVREYAPDALINDLSAVNVMENAAANRRR